MGETADELRDRIGGLALVLVAIACIYPVQSILAAALGKSYLPIK